MPGVDWAGTYDLSWWDLQEFIRHECRDSTSAMWRTINPEVAGADPIDVLLLRYVAQATTDMRWLAAAQVFGEDIPDKLERIEFAIPGREADEGEPNEGVEVDEDAIAVAEGLRDEIFA